MSETLIVCARIEAKKEKIDFVKSEVMKLVEPTRNETGCIQYILHQDIERPEIFIFFEVWENEVSCNMHMNNDHTKDFITAVNEAVSNIEISKMRKIF